MDLEKFFLSELTLKNELLLLRPLTINDIHDIEKISYSKELGEFGARVKNKEDLDDYFDFCLKSKVKKELYPFIIIERKSNKPIGITMFGNINFQSRRLEIGWTWITKAKQGRPGLTQLGRRHPARPVGHPRTHDRVGLPFARRDGPTRKAIMANSDMAGKYDTAVDRESAFEMLAKRADDAAKAAEAAEAEEEALEEKEREFKAARRYDGGSAGKSSSRRSSRSSGGGFGSALASVVAKELKGTTGRRIVRGIFGNLFKGN